jgi:hypothetical protein
MSKPKALLCALCHDTFPWQWFVNDRYAADTCPSSRACLTGGNGSASGDRVGQSSANNGQSAGLDK